MQQQLKTECMQLGPGLGGVSFFVEFRCSVSKAHHVAEVAQLILVPCAGSAQAALEHLPPVDLLLHGAARYEAVHDHISVCGIQSNSQVSRTESIGLWY